MRKEYQCTSCEQITSSPKMKGSRVVARILWLGTFFLGVIYSIWRIKAVSNICPNCNKPELIPYLREDHLFDNLKNEPTIECPWCAEVILAKIKICTNCQISVEEYS